MAIERNAFKSVNSNDEGVENISNLVNASNNSNSRQQSLERKGKALQIAVHFLDDSVTVFIVQPKVLGNWLFEQVCNVLNLVETDYFGLEYFDSNHSRYWIDLEKPITRQLSFNYANPKLNFSVKFYTPDPSKLEDELTRYLYALQIKRDLSEGSLQCNENSAALMASYIIQAEIGDFNSDEYDDQNYITKFNLIPHQDASFEWKVMENHKKHIGQSPADADINLLETARRCELYGVKLSAVTDHEGVPLNLAVNHSGVLIFQNTTKVNTFPWSKIRKLSFKRKRFLVKLHKEEYFGDVVEFFFNNRNESKSFWKKCIEHHTFFRCPFVKKPVKQKARIFSRGSSFRYSGRTQQEMIEYVRQTSIRRNHFQRSSLKNSRRQESDLSGLSVQTEPLLPVSTPNLDEIKLDKSAVDSQRSYSSMDCRTDSQENRVCSTGSSHQLKDSVSGSNNSSLNAQTTLCNNFNSELDNISHETFVSNEQLNESYDSVVNSCDMADASFKSHATESNTVSLSKSADVKETIKKDISGDDRHKELVAGRRKQKSRSRKKVVTRDKDNDQKRRALSASRCKFDLNRKECRTFKVSPSLFAHSNQLNSNRKSRSAMHYVFVNSLPSLESFSSRDDTYVDPINEYISQKVENLLKKQKLMSMQTASADELNSRHSINTLSSNKSLKERCSASDDHSDIPFDESDYGSIEFSVDTDAKERQSMKQCIIDSYLTAHFPDDFDVEKLVDIYSEQVVQNESPYIFLSDLITESYLKSVINL